MSLSELLPSVQTLPRADKVRLAHILIAELSGDEGVRSAQDEPQYPVWTPYNAFEAAAALTKALSGGKPSR